MALLADWRPCAIATALLILSGAASGQERTWTDATGKFTVRAELVEVDQGNVVLRRSDGKEITVPLQRLRDTDRAFIDERSADDKPLDSRAAGKAVAQIARRFYGDLRSREREVAKEALTKKAQTLFSTQKSPLVDLPTPDSGRRTVRVGKVTVDGKLAEVPVQVRAGGVLHKTKLHLRYESVPCWAFCGSPVVPDAIPAIGDVRPATPRGDPDRGEAG